MPRRRHSAGVGEAQSFPTLPPSSSRVPSLGDMIAPHLADGGQRRAANHLRRDSGETYREMLTRMAKESGVETPTIDDLVRLDRKRKGKKLSNEDWMNRDASQHRRQGQFDAMAFMRLAWLVSRIDRLRVFRRKVRQLLKLGCELEAAAHVPTRAAVRCPSSREYQHVVQEGTRLNLSFSFLDSFRCRSA